MTVLHKVKKCFKQMGRRKNLARTVQEKSELGKVLSLLDLTALGVGCTLGVGVYVLPGMVAKDLAGPAVIVSFFIAAVTSILAGLCFAEFGARVPKAGSAYVYSYVTMGEFVAFTIGWTLIMEYIIGTASVARGLSLYIDSLVGNQMEAFYREIYEIEGATFLSEYFDVFACLISIVVTNEDELPDNSCGHVIYPFFEAGPGPLVLLKFSTPNGWYYADIKTLKEAGEEMGLAYGVKESMVMNNLLTSVNVLIVLFVIIVGSIHINFENWSLPENNVPMGAGKGGFWPFGVIGAIKGASTCFYGYVGFDVIATTGEEVKNPARSVPLSIIFSLLIVFLAYSGISAVITLMWPYYLQDSEAPIPFVFTSIGWDWAAWVVAIGGIFGLLASLLTGMFSLPRILYSMANDGLLYRNLGEVHPKYRTPFKGTIIAGVITGLMGAAFQLKHLVDLMSIATLLTYTIVSACVLLLRYREEEEDQSVTAPLLGPKRSRMDLSQVVHQIFTIRSVSTPTRVSSAVVNLHTILYCILTIAFSHVLVSYEVELSNGGVGPIVAAIFLATAMLILLILISVQPSDTSKLPFKTPWVPLVPALSIFLNVYLMILMSFDTWLRFITWMAAGYLIYFTYGLWESSERRRDPPFRYDNLTDVENWDDRPKK